MKKSKLSIYEKEIVDMYFNQKMSTIKIAKIYNVNQSVVNYFLKSLNYNLRSNKENSQIYSINSNFFEKINNENNAYWLGFMFADGYVSKENHVGLSLSIVDKSHLEKFKKDLETNYPINIYKRNTDFGEVEYCRLFFRNDKMRKDLIDIGCVEHKSLILKFPNLNRNLTKHFIRGYLDGDGTIGIYSNRKTIRVRFAGTKEFLEGIAIFIKEELNLDYSCIRKEKRNEKNNYSLEYGGRLKVKKLLDFLYKDTNIYLERKYNKYLEV